VKRIRGKKQPLTAAGLQALRDEYTRTLAAETLALEHTLSDLINEAHARTWAKIELMWETAPASMPMPPLSSPQECRSEVNPRSAARR
jgi:hypothetical protein